MSKIPVTMPFLPRVEELNTFLSKIWESGILTHNGPTVQEFERLLSENIGLMNPVAVTNGTIAIQMAIRALGIKGEIITSPFTWIASISAIIWEGSAPVFCDIDPSTLNLDPAKIESLITSKTVAIMPVHVFGNPCDVESIEEIAKKHNLKVIYDAAHAVGSVYNDKSLLNCGDVSATSFHATKIINTAEGGGCVTEDLELSKKLKRIRFFGYNDQKDVVEDGFNGKMTEVHAALGILNVNSFDKILADRKNKYMLYKSMLSQNQDLRFQENQWGIPNYSYFPVIFPSESDTLRIIATLESNDIIPRRYFYPSVNTYTNIVTYQPCPISEDISRRILCLPLYYSLIEDDVSRICDIILQSYSKSTN